MNEDTLIGLLIIALIVYFFRKRAKNIDKKYNDHDNTYNNYDEYNKWQNRQGKYRTSTQRETDIIKQNYVQTSMLTSTEQAFYNQLKEALKHYDIEIHYKIRLADIFKVKYRNKYYETNFSRIMAKHIDFIIADKSKAEAIIAIELDDASHEKEESYKNDTFKNILFEASDIRLLRIKVQPIYDFAELKQMLKSYLNVNYVLNKENISAADRVEKKMQEDAITKMFKDEPEPETIYK